MIESVSVSHYIQKYIIDVLMYVQVARFRDLRPLKTDTNLFTYHLNSLVKNGIVVKVEGGYSLSLLGLSYVDRVSAENKVIRTQPKIITMLLIQNSEGDMLLQRRSKQPYINAWTLPYGKLHIDDPSVITAAKREAKEKLGLDNQEMRHIGDCYIRVKTNGEILSTTLAHIFAFNRDDIKTSDDVVWARPHKLRDFRLAPAVEEIAARGFFNDPFFFEEFDTAWIA
ncbi:NUDIX hydrolase [Candidatus Saccharibacteria bacterium]|nr:NUDIX hydrolase [Candidatus Saccharibacteria bacterium]